MNKIFYSTKVVSYFRTIFLLLVMLDNLSALGQEILTNSGKQLMQLTQPINLTQTHGFTVDPEIQREQLRTTSISSQSLAQETTIIESTSPTVVSSVGALTATVIDFTPPLNRVNYLLAYTKWQSDVQKRLNSLNSGLDELSKLPTFSDEYISKSLKAPVLLLRDSIKISLYTINNVHTLYDTLYNFPKREKNLEELSKQSAKLDILNDRANDLSTDIRRQFNNVGQLNSKYNLIRDKIKQIQNIRNSSPLFDMDPGINLNNDVAAKVKIMVVQVSAILDSISQQVYPELRKEILFNKDSFTNYTTEFNSISKDFNSWFRIFMKYKSDSFKSSEKSSVVESEFGAIPSVSQLLGDVRAPTINISVLGSRNVFNKNSNSTLTARIFTSSVPLNLATARSFFLPEVSTFGSQIKYSASRKLTFENTGTSPSKFITNIGLNGELNFLNKRISTPLSGTSTTPQSTSGASIDHLVAQLRLGVEVVVFKEFFSVYANANGLSLLDNTDKFHGYFRDSNNQEFSRIRDRNGWVFFDIGGRLWLNPSGTTAKQLPSSDLYIVADFNLIFPQLWGRQIIQRKEDVVGTDKIIPVVRLGIQKNLGTLLKN